ncbi:MAG: carbohydrate-binding domain-containing protein, partial [Verrucomicrobiota bacterium]
YHDHNGDGFCERIVQYVNTSGSGSYSFNGITDTGLYQVGVDPLGLPDDLYRLTARDQSGNEADDNDVDRDTFRTEIFQINSTGDSLTDISDIGFLQGSGVVTYEGTSTVNNEPTHYWKYQDLEFYLQDLGYDPVSASTLEIVTRWLKWYAIGERILQEAEVLPGYLEYQRYGGTAADSVKRFNTVNGLGSFAAGAKFISSGIPPATLFNEMNDDPTEHNLMFYETTRGANPIWKYRGTWPHGGRLTHHGLAATIHWEILGAASINKVPAQGGWTPVETSRLGLWETEGTTFVNAFPMVLQPGGGQPGLPDQFEHDNHYGNYGGILGGSRDILAAILVTVMIDNGRDKVVEILHNLSTKNHYAPSMEQALINFRDAVNDATDGAYATRLTNDWGFPAAASYADSRTVDSGTLPGGTTFLWDCKPHTYDPADIRPGYTHLSDRTTQGFGRFSDSNGTSLRNLGAVDRLIPSGSGVQYPNERAYLVIGEGVEFVQQIPNGAYRVEMHTVENGVANVSFPNDQVLASTSNVFGVEVTDGELNILGDGITRVYQIEITEDSSINQPTVFFREEFDNYTAGSIAGQQGPSGVWTHTNVQGTFQLGAGLSGANGLVIDSTGSNDLEIPLPSMLATRIWMSYLYNESSYGGHFYVSGVGHPWSNVFGINNVGGSVTYTGGQTYRVVALYDYDANTTTMWIDPDPGSEPVTDPSAPGYAPAVVYNGLVSDLTTLKISSYCDGTIDDIRVTNNYTSAVSDGQVVAPGVNTGAATNVGEASADLAYSLTDGGEAASVTLYYGTTDGGGNAGSWSSSQALGTQGSGSYSAALSGLTADTTYFYNFEGVNSGGSSWGTSGSFTTGSAPPPSSGDLRINVDWGKGTPVHSGSAATGLAGDVWNAADPELNDFTELENVLDATGATTTVDVTWTDELQSSANTGAIEFGSSGHNDLMEDYGFTAPGTTATVTIASLDPNVDYTLYLYGVPDGQTQDTTFTVTGANEGSQTVTAGNVADDNGLANPDDYVVFTGNTGSGGSISYTQTGSTFSGSNGFQLELDTGGSTPFGGSPRDLTSTIESEDYDEGGAGVAYSDSDASNNGGAYRTDEVDIEATGDAGGGFNVGWTSDGEWLLYTVQATAGDYEIELRAASAASPGSAIFELDGQILGNIDVSNTGGWQGYQTFTSGTVTVPSTGTGVIRVLIQGGGFNMNWFRFVDPGPVVFAPSVSTGGASGVDDSSATLDYTLTDGGEASAVMLYYGTNDGGTDPGAWQGSVSQGAQATGSYSAGLSGLAGGTTYYFTFLASNSAGSDWGSVGSFTTTPDDSPKLLRTTVSGVGSDSWTTVNLPVTYNSPVVIATPIYPDASTASVVTRIRNVNGTAFEVQLDRADGQTGAVSLDVSLLVVDEGVYNQGQHGVTMEAVKYLSTVTAENNNWAVENRSFQNSYTSPVVVGQVMSANDANWSVFWSRGSNRQSPVDDSNLNVGKHVGEDPNATRADETIGYIVIESGTGTLDGVAYEAGLGADSVRGVNNSSTPYTYSLSGALSSASVAAASISGMDGGNGGWAVLGGSTPISSSSLSLWSIEDQVGDNERSHTTTQVAYIVFE